MVVLWVFQDLMVFLEIVILKKKKNYRTRCSALIKSKKENILIDTSPDIRSQLIANHVTDIDRILYTHQHGDQTHGINDLRVFYLKKKKVLPIYADKKTSKYLKKTFSYCFNTQSPYANLVTGFI